MEAPKFNVKFVTPLLIGGAAHGSVDANGLSGKALRGCWRFWCRAIIGGVMDGITIDKLNKLENEVFGSADGEIGSKFRLNVEEHKSNRRGRFDLGFRGQRKPGFTEGASYSITLIPRTTMGEREKNILFATIWLWGNLGAVGNRSRRGFGSPVLYLEDMGKNPFEFKNIDGKDITLLIEEQPFSGSNELENHLKNGLKSVWNVYKQWIGSTDSGDISTLLDPKNAPYFILKSLEQIVVGDQGYSKRDDAITAVHGMRNCRGLGWGGESKMASPVFIRFHKVVGKDGQDKFLPIVTWCKQKNVKDTKNCAEKYLTDMKIGGIRVFTHDLR